MVPHTGLAVYVTLLTHKPHIRSYSELHHGTDSRDSSDLHGAVETLAAPAIMAAPFVLGFGQATAAIAIAFGVVLLGLALSLFGPRRSIPLSAHAGLDYALASFVVVPAC